MAFASRAAFGRSRLQSRKRGRIAAAPRPE